jgi:hypothetical protein
MSTKTLSRILNIIAAIGLTVGGASAIPGSNLPPVVLFYGLLLASIAKAVASELTQIKGESDETQGITPQQIASVAAVHAAAVAASPNVPTTATTTTTTTAVSTPPTATKLGLLALFLVGSLFVSSCKSATTTALNADAVIITSVNAAMTAWASEVNSGKATAAQITTVSNAYNVYYNSQLTLSNLASLYVASPSTNLSQAILLGEQTLAASATNIVSIVNTLTK